jgi:deazaflavin-dependent oxidoreductase (nitroreductase family)
VPLHGDYAPGTAAWAGRQAERFEKSGGAKAATLGGRPIVVLTSVGAVTGSLRKTALMRVEHGGEYAVVASNGGSARDPAWAANLRREPHVELQDGPTRRDYTAHEVEGEARRIWWERAVEAFPQYGRYQARTRRRIPLFVLTPREP